MLPLLFARRYLFSRKSTNAINVISGIAVLGMTLGSAALIIVLSVFNGFEDLITSLYNAFNPDLKVVVRKGKVFVPEAAQFAALKKITGVVAVAQCLEEVAFFEYEKRQDFGIIKGVDTAFERCNGIRPAIKRGTYQLNKGTQAQAVVGMGMEYKLGINVDDPFNTLKVYMPKRNAEAAMSLTSAPFKMLNVVPVGVFSIQADFDGQYILTNLEYTRELLSYSGGEVSSVEIGLAPNADLSRIQREVTAIMGSDYTIKNRYEQDESFYKIMNMERWFGFAIAAFTLLLVAFNMVGALWMLVIDKRSDIAVLKAMGATRRLIQQIFLVEGLLLAGAGMVLGFAIAIVFILAQWQFGIIKLEGNMVVDSYPISMRFSDFVLVACTVAVIGLVASWLPARRAAAVEEINLG